MYKKYIKRFLDILLSLSVLILFSPLLLLTAILVRIKLG
ncbi:MAG: sugar transferase, partial [Lachnospiraceae bacterium]|nr:sugar transferase [Lachnospiraceae bacterium]